MRYLMCMDGGSLVLAPGKVGVFLPSKPFVILEGRRGVTPIRLASTHVTEETADELVKNGPGDWIIVGGNDELEGLFQ